MDLAEIRSALPLAARKQIGLAKNNVALGGGVQLISGRVHEVTGASADGFIATILGRTQGHIVWIGRSRDINSICPQAVQRFFCPSRLICVEALSRKEILWAAEQALRSRGASVVVAELGRGPDLMESRRLQISAEKGKTLGLIRIGKTAQSSAAQTRWDCHAVLPSDAVMSDVVTPDMVANDHAVSGDHIWKWEMTKNKNGQTGCWTVGWRRHANDSGHVDMVPAASA